MDRSFNIKKFRAFVESHIVWLGHRKDSITKKQILDAVCQFDKPTYQILRRTKSNGNKHIRRIFNAPTDPKGVAINTWFLWKYGYKRCQSCLTILPLDDFYIDTYQWSKKRGRCKICESKLSHIYYLSHKTEKTQRYREWSINNRDKLNAKDARYKANKKRNTPTNLTKQDYIEIEDIYWCSLEMTSILGIQFNVDHIWPLSKGGLHVPWNLQIISAKENFQKKDKILENIYNIKNFQQWMESL